MLFTFWQADEYAKLSEEFFQLSEEEKVKFSRPKGSTDNAGWAAIGREA